MTLHEAIKIVITEAGRPMSASVIARRINERGLYKRKDEQPVPASQVTARVGRYERQFYSREGLIGLLNKEELLKDSYFKLISLLAGRWSHAEPHLLMASIYFYRRVHDCREIWEKYFASLGTYQKNYDRSGPENFYAFYKSLGSASSDNLYSGFGLLGEAVLENNKYMILEFDGKKSPFAEALEELVNINFSMQDYSIETYGVFFEFVLAQTYKDIRSEEILSTPTLGKLLVYLGKPTPKDNIYIPYAGSGGIPSLIRRMTGTEVNFFGVEFSKKDYLQGMMNLVMNDLDVNGLHLGDTLKGNVQLCHGASLSITVLPKYSDRTYEEDRYKSVFVDIRIDLIRKILDSLNETGRVVLVVGEDFLSGSDPDLLEFKEYLLKNNLLEGVIALPYKASSLKREGNSIIILNKAKSFKEILFFDAVQPGLYQEEHFGNTLLESHKIASIYQKFLNHFQNYNGDVLLLEEALAGYGVTGNNDQSSYGKGRVVSVTGISEIEKAGYNLQANRHVGVLAVFEAMQAQNDSFVKLKKLLKIPDITDPRIESGFFPLIKRNHITELSDEFPVVRRTELKISEKEQSGRAVTSDSILISRNSSSLEPTLLLTEGGKVLLYPSRFDFFLIDTEKVDPYYLVWQMRDDFFRNQLKTYSHYDNTRGIKNTRDILEMYIPYPSMEEQRKIVTERKAAILNKKIRSADQFAKTEQLRYDADKEILRMLKHELTPLGEAIEMNIETLKRYIARLNKAGETPHFKDPASTRDASRTVEELFSVLLSDAAGIKDIIVDLQKIIDANREGLNLVPLRICELIQRIAASHRQGSDFELIIHEEEKGLPGSELIGDEGQFRILLDNFFKNSLKHGFAVSAGQPTNSAKKKNYILFNISYDEGKEFLNIDMINNGRPFPEEFSFEDFIRLGSHAGNGTGIGGYLMHKIVANHGGRLEMPDFIMGIDIEVQDPDKPGGIVNRTLQPGVHFRITLPLNMISDE
jgi:signal transduction histidine kinase